METPEIYEALKLNPPNSSTDFKSESFLMESDLLK